MLKALDLLKEQYNILNNGIDGIWINPKKLDEAIKELEALQNRSCDNCKYNKEQDGFMIFCDKEMCQDGSKMMWHSFTKDFSCNKWEVKNECS